MKRQQFLILFGLFFLLSCSTTRNKDNANVTARPLPYKKVLTDVEKAYPTYHSMSSDIRLQAKFDGISYSATGEIRHVRDSAIFATVRKLGFEIGRILITTDSIFVLNRWEKEYIRAPISAIEKAYDIKGDFELVEELLTGIPRIKSYTKNERSGIESNTHRAEVTSFYPGIDLTLWLDAINFEVTQAFYSDWLDRAIRMKYGVERSEKVVLIRELHTENIKDNEIHIKLEFRNPEFNETSLPTFTIPSHYTRGSL